MAITQNQMFDEMNIHEISVKDIFEKALVTKVVIANNRSGTQHTDEYNDAIKRGYFLIGWKSVENNEAWMVKPTSKALELFTRRSRGLLKSIRVTIVGCVEFKSDSTSTYPCYIAGMINKSEYNAFLMEQTEIRIN